MSTPAHIPRSFFFLPPVYFMARFERVFFPNQGNPWCQMKSYSMRPVTLSCSRTIIKHREGPGAQGKEGTVIIEQCWKKQANSTVLLEVLLLLPYGRQRRIQPLQPSAVHSYPFPGGTSCRHSVTSNSLAHFNLGSQFSHNPVGMPYSVASEQ